MTLHLTWFEFLGQPLSAHQDREGIPATVGFMDFSDLNCVVHQEILDGNRLCVPKQRVRVVPHGKEAEHLTGKGIDILSLQILTCAALYMKVGLLFCVLHRYTVLLLLLFTVVQIRVCNGSPVSLE